MKINLVKYRLHQWLFTALVLLSSFTFSGLAIQNTNHPVTANTTLVAGIATRYSKVISYQRAAQAAKFIKKDIKLPVNPCYSLSCFHTQQLAVAFRHILAAADKRRPYNLFYIIKICPQNTAAEPPFCLT